MDISKIKNLIRQNGDKFIILENGEPELVIMSFAEYEKIQGRSPEEKMNQHFSPISKKEDPVENYDKQDLPNSKLHDYDFTPIAVGEPIGLPVRLEDIRLEDLPI